MASELDQTDVVDRVFDAVRALVASAPERIGCEYEYLPTDRSELPCVTMQVLSGDPVERRYLDGGIVARLPIALVLRQAADDTACRLDAQRTLRGLAGALRSLAEPGAAYELDLGPGTSLREIARGAGPARLQAQPGMTDYQVTLVVKYKTQQR